MFLIIGAYTKRERVAGCCRVLQRERVAGCCRVLQRDTWHIYRDIHELNVYIYRDIHELFSLHCLVIIFHIDVAGRVAGCCRMLQRQHCRDIHTFINIIYNLCMHRWCAPTSCGSHDVMVITSKYVPWSLDQGTYERYVSFVSLERDIYVTVRAAWC